MKKLHLKYYDLDYFYFKYKYKPRPKNVEHTIKTYWNTEPEKRRETIHEYVQLERLIADGFTY